MITLIRMKYFSLRLYSVECSSNTFEVTKRDASQNHLAARAFAR